MTGAGHLVVGIDVGTTSTKAVLLDPAGGLRAQASRPVELQSPGTGQAQADPGSWWANLTELVPELLATAGTDADAVGGVAVTGMVPAVVLVDDSGAPLRPALLQNDARATEEIRTLREALPEADPVRLTGSPVTQQSVAPSLMWLRHHEPDAWSRAVAVVGSYDWVAHALGAPLHVETNWALESGLRALDGSSYAAMVTAAGLDDDLVPPVRRPGEQVGEVSPAAAAETGLRAGTPIVVGGADHVLSAYAAGLQSAGRWLVKLGGGGDILAVAGRPVADPRLYLDAHPDPALWLPNGCMATSGSLLRWLTRLVGEDDLSLLDREAEGRPPGEVLCLPYFLGEKSPIHDVDVRGAFVGLDLHHDRATLFRAALEAVAFGFRHHVDVLDDIGVALDGAPRITDGGAASALWRQIHADVLGRPVVPVLDHPGGSLGAALVAAVGVGLLPGWTLAEDFVRLGDPTDPDATAVASYTDAYGLWRELSDTLTPISHALAERSRTR